ncbi:MAG: peptidoglycan-binding protein [Myxococcaceae bacterium]|nr:peptidoglycan-binding protein [Myxococcaceae bacterium]
MPGKVSERSAVVPVRTKGLEAEPAVSPSTEAQTGWVARGARTRPLPPAELERVNVAVARPAWLSAADRATLGREAHPVVPKGREQALSDVRQRADGNYELDFTLVDAKGQALLNDVNRVTLVVGPDGKILDGLLPESRMRELGIDRMPSDTPEQQAFKREVIAAEAAEAKAERHALPAGHTTERPTETEPAASSTVGVRANRGRYSTAPPDIMEDVRSGGARRLSLERGHKGEGVLETQRLLNRLGAGLAEDGKLGPLSEGAIKQFQKAAGLPETGKVDAATYEKLKNAKPGDFKLEPPPASVVASVRGATVPTGERLEQIRTAILDDPRIPDEWATDSNALAAINRVIEKESGWRVGIPNYTITNAGISRERAIAELQSGRKNLTHLGAASSAMGLGQLLGTNMDRYMPSGRQGIGDLQEELRGALAYMKDRYDTPQAALAFHNSKNWW